jgi:ceramide glucosyltransferase
MLFIHKTMLLIGFASLAIAAGYALLNALAVLIWRLPRRKIRTLSQPPITVLKPLCGLEPGLYEHLRSFCQQDYPQFEIVFGVRDQADPACSVAYQLVAEFPELPLKVVINPKLHGDNCKVSNLINMLPHATHDLLAISDSDTAVARDYLTTVTAPLLLDDLVGLVTCIYCGVPTQPIWSRLGAMYVNEWYMPSVVLAWLFGHQGYVSGQTMCLRRDTLAAIGGLEVLADQLADDYRLGELVRRSGRRIVLSPYVISAQHHEMSLDAVIRHELRWMRTLRTVRPASFRGLFLTFSLPLATLGIAITAWGSGSGSAWVLFTATLFARLILHCVHRLRGDRPFLADVWLIPARDLLICWAWCRSFFISTITWRGSEFDIDGHGAMHRRFGHSAPPGSTRYGSGAT